MRPVHWFKDGEKTLCGVKYDTIPSYVMYEKDKGAVTCKRCLHGLKHDWGKK